MDGFFSVCAVKKKYKAWQCYMHFWSDRHYKEYCILRNKATKAVRYARKRHEKSITNSVKDTCKSFWSVQQ